MQVVNALQKLSDEELLRHLSELVSRSRRVEADLVAHIAEVDERRLYASKACSSMFAYATEVLHFSEAEAYLRVAVARATRKFPTLLLSLKDGRLHLSAIALLAPHLTDENCESVLARAEHKSKRQVEEVVAQLAPRPDVPSTIRRLHAPMAPVAQLRPDGVERPVLVPPPQCTDKARVTCKARATRSGALQGLVHRKHRAASLPYSQSLSSGAGLRQRSDGQAPEEHRQSL